jgi:uncharacterized protein Yka (UPF0111/DUF47 family)
MARRYGANEKAMDPVARQTVQLLHTTFATPFDRDEIHQLVTGMDDIVDLMADVATCLFVYDVNVLTPDVR